MFAGREQLTDPARPQMHEPHFLTGSTRKSIRMDHCRRQRATCSPKTRARRTSHVWHYGDMGPTARGELQPIARAKATVRVARALVRQRGSIAAHHLGVAPATEAH